MSNSVGIAATQSIDKGVAFEEGHRYSFEDIGGRTATQGIFRQGQLVEVAGQDSDQHVRLSPTFKQSMQSRQSSFAVAAHQLVAKFKVGKLTRPPDQVLNHCQRNSLRLTRC